MPDTSWVKPIYFEPATVQWLNEQPDWPSTLLPDLDKIKKHNEKVEALNK